MGKMFLEMIKRILENSMTLNANSTTTFFLYQPKAPSELKKFSRHVK